MSAGIREKRECQWVGGGKGKKNKQRTEGVFLVLATGTKTETPVVFAYAPVDAVPKALIELHRNRVCAADIQVDEKAVVYVIGHGLEEVHEDTSERQATVFRGDRQRGDMPMEVIWGALGLA